MTTGKNLFGNRRIEKNRTFGEKEIFDHFKNRVGVTYYQGQSDFSLGPELFLNKGKGNFEIRVKATSKLGLG